MAEKIKILLKHFNPSKVNTTYRCICSKAYNSPHGRPQPLTDACNPIAVYLFKDNFLNFYSLNLLQTEEVWQKAIQKHFFLLWSNFSDLECNDQITSTSWSRKSCKKSITSTEFPCKKRHTQRSSLCKLSFFYLCLVQQSFQGLKQPPK